MLEWGLNKVDQGEAEAISASFDNWLKAGRNVSHPRYLEYNSFSGSDIKAAVWVPPNPISGRREGSYKLWAELQTITVSSARPPGAVRALGLAGVRDYIRGVRTIAGSMIFTVFNRDVFYELYQKSSKESPAEHPIFVDMIPPFHVLIDANNEMGSSATASILDITLSNYGTTYSIDDLMLESTYSYVAKYVTPLAIKDGWHSGLAQAVSKMDGGLVPASARSRAPKPIRLVQQMDVPGYSGGSPTQYFETS